MPVESGEAGIVADGRVANALCKCGVAFGCGTGDRSKVGGDVRKGVGGADCLGLNITNPANGGAHLQRMTVMVVAEVFVDFWRPFLIQKAGIGGIAEVGHAGNRNGRSGHIGFKRVLLLGTVRNLNSKFVHGSGGNHRDQLHCSGMGPINEIVGL